MNSRLMRWRLLGAGLFAATAIAPTSALAQRPPPGGLTAPGVEYLNGGVSSEEADELRAQATNYPLQIQFTQGNAFVASVGVRIFDARGNTVLALPAADPILLADLPPGRYTVEATYEGRIKRQDVAVGRGHHKMGFQW